MLGLSLIYSFIPSLCRIPTGKSLFYYRGGPRKCRSERVKHYCTCEERCCGKRQINCDFTGFQKRPKYRNGKKFWRNLNFPGGKHCGKRKRRSTTDQIVLPDDDEDLLQYLYDPEQITPVVPQWPTPKGKTLTGTRSFCNREIGNSEVAKVCMKLIDGFDVTDFVVECVSDIQVNILSFSYFMFSLNISLAILIIDLFINRTFAH